MADLLSNVVRALSARKDLLGWSAHHRHMRGEQLFADRSRIEARRSVEIDEVGVEVLAASDGAEADGLCGAAQVTVTVGEDPSAAIDFAVRAARRTRNPRYALPDPAPLPEVPLADERLRGDLAGAAAALQERLWVSAGSDRSARLTLAEWFVEDEAAHLVNSMGVDARQERTEISLEWIALAGDGDGRVETVFDFARRRLADVDVEGEWGSVAQQTADRHRAGPAPSLQGPVVLRGRSLGTFLHGGTIQTLASARARFAKISHWEVGKPALPEGSGDRLTLHATRLLPYGVNAGRFDGEGLPGRRLELIRDNVLQTYSASQRYATYLEVPPTGAFGDIEVLPGSVPAADLMAEPHVEIVSWSWFSPNPTTGDFASEIRLGYQVDGQNRRPFTGGLLVGNLLQALADTRWGKEVGFFGDYLGPTTARVSSLQVTPSREA